MKSLGLSKTKRSAKSEREHRVLLGLVDLYIKTGQPIGSNTLRDHGFKDLSSATIRNYFANLEQADYLIQHHSSGGRVPSDKAFRAYADEYIKHTDLSINDRAQQHLKALSSQETSEITSYLHKAADILGNLTECAVILSMPRFDHDVIRELKLVAIDNNRCLCVIITDFGLIQTHMLYTAEKLSSFSLKRIESFFRWRLSSHGNSPEDITSAELTLAQEFYNEVIVRYMIGYANFSHDDLYHAGLSNLLSHPEFNDAATLADGLSLFENPAALRLLIKQCLHTNELHYWIGDDLTTPLHSGNTCSVVGIPYHINNSPVGVVGILGPLRMPYRKLFPLLRAFSESISDALTRSLYKFKISFRQPQEGTLYLKKEERRLLNGSSAQLLEDKSR